MQYFIGIDPGVNGGTCVINDNFEIASLIKHSYYTGQDYANWITHLKGCTGFAAVEKVQAFPTDSRSSAFTFGCAYGQALRSVQMLGFSHYLIPPETWRKEAGIAKKDKIESKTQYKTRLKENAQRLFPSAKIQKEEADSVLIAYVAYKRSFYGTWSNV